MMDFWEWADIGLASVWDGSARGGLPFIGEQLLQAAGRMSVDASEDISEVSAWIDIEALERG
jgi:hypothetical protein